MSALKGQEWMRTKALLGALITILSVAGLLWLGYALRAIALLVVLAILFAYVLAPLVARCEAAFRWRGRHRGMSRSGAIATVYLSLIAITASAIYLLVPRIAHQLGALDQALSQGIESAHQHIREGLLAAAGLFVFLPWLVLIPVIAAFLLNDAPAFRSSVLTLLPEGRVRWRGREFFEDVNQTIAHVVRAQLLSCLIIGLACTLGFLILGVPFALLLGVGAGLLEFVPLAGPLTVMVAAGLIAGTHSTQLGVYTVLFLVLLRAVQDNVIYPRLIASGIKLHPLVVILALLCGVELAGVVGLFLAIPITAFLSVSYRHLRRQWRGNGLLAEMLEAREPEPLSVPPVSLPDGFPSARSFGTPVENLRVLVVDDDENARALLAALLRGQGAIDSTAGSAAQALGMLGMQRFDAMLSDIGMPHEDGFELIRQVRALPAAQGGNTPAAALTGYTNDEDRKRANAAGFQKHLGKPIDASELFRTVAALAGRSSSL